eukprot:gene892-9803_t
MKKNPKRVIIDTDPGIDDVMALFLALSAPQEIQVDAITIIFGNHSDLNLLGKNACLVLQLAKRNDIPVYLGETKPLKSELNTESGKKVHGMDGIGNLSKLPVKKIDETPIQKNKTASEFIIEHCQKYPNEITIVTIGPLTNLAVAIQKESSLSNIVKEIVCMGGSLNKRGNKSPTAEANILCDAEAAKLVFASNFNFTLLPLNLTENITLSKEYLNQIKELGIIGKFIHDTNQHYIDFLDGIGLPYAVHDSMTIFYLLHPEHFDKPISVFVDVEVSGELTYGKFKCLIEC